MRLHRKETAKRLSFLKYWKLNNKRHWIDHDFCLLKIHQKKHVEVASILHPSHLYRKCTLKWRRLFTHPNYIKKSTSIWRGNSSILTCRRNFDIDSTCWVCWYNRMIFGLVSTQNQCCFNVEFSGCFNVDKMTLFRRWNTVISSILI